LAAMSELPFLLKADKIIWKLGVQNTLILSMGVIGLRFLLLFFIKTALWVYPIALLNGLTFIVFTFSLAVYINKTVKKELRATGQTIHGFAMAIGKILGSISGGFLVEGFGLLNTMLFFFLFCVTSILGFITINFVMIKKYSITDTECLK
jgi:PPP family 3-phenylpropionic acid transporter